MQGSYSSSFEKFSGKKQKHTADDMPTKRIQGNKHRQARKNKQRLMEHFS